MHITHFFLCRYVRPVVASSTFQTELSGLLLFVINLYWFYITRCSVFWGFFFGGEGGGGGKGGEGICRSGLCEKSPEIAPCQVRNSSSLELLKPSFFSSSCSLCIWPLLSSLLTEGHNLGWVPNLELANGKQQESSIPFFFFFLLRHLNLGWELFTGYTGNLNDQLILDTTV